MVRTQEAALTSEEILFFAGRPQALALYEAIRARVLGRFPDVTLEVKKTQISFKARRLFLMVSLPRSRAQGKDSLILTFGLHRAAAHPLIFQCVEPYPNRFTHHVLLRAAEEMDGALMELLEEAYAACQAGKA